MTGQILLLLEPFEIPSPAPHLRNNMMTREPLQGLSLGTPMALAHIPSRGAIIPHPWMRVQVLRIAKMDNQWLLFFAIPTTNFKKPFYIVSWIPKKRFVQEYSPTHLRPKGSRIAGQRQSHGRWDGCLPKLKAIKIACLMLNAIDWRLLIFYPTSTQVRRLGGREQKLDLRLGPLQLGLCLVSTSMKIMQILCGHSFAWSDTNSTKYHHAV